MARLQVVAEYLLQSEFDVVGLQELWIRADYDRMAEQLKPKYPYSYSFKRYAPQLAVGSPAGLVG